MKSRLRRHLLSKRPPQIPPAKTLVYSLLPTYSHHTFCGTSINAHDQKSAGCTFPPRGLKLFSSLYMYSSKFIIISSISSQLAATMPVVCFIISILCLRDGTVSQTPATNVDSFSFRIWLFGSRVRWIMIVVHSVRHLPYWKMVQASNCLNHLKPATMAFLVNPTIIPILYSFPKMWKRIRRIDRKPTFVFVSFLEKRFLPSWYSQYYLCLIFSP